MPTTVKASSETALMRYYPVNLDIRNRQCLVVGGGDVGNRKAKRLIECGGKVTVVAPETTENLKALASEGVIDLKTRAYQPSDLDNTFLVIGATNDEHVNHRISHDAARQGVLCNIADDPEVCSFVLPAIVCQGHLVIAISTANKSPAVAKRIRQALEKEFGPEYATLLDLMGALRQRLQAEAKSPEAHKQIFERLLDDGLLEMIRKGRTHDVTSLLKDVLEDGCTWEDLMGSEQATVGLDLT